MNVPIQVIKNVGVAAVVVTGVIALLLYKHQKTHLKMQADVAAIDKEIKMLQLKKLKENS